MTGLQIFAFEGVEVRTGLRDGELWWVATEATKIVGIPMAPLPRSLAASS